MRDVKPELDLLVCILILHLILLSVLYHIKYMAIHLNRC